MVPANIGNSNKILPGVIENNMDDELEQWINEENWE